MWFYVQHHKLYLHLIIILTRDSIELLNQQEGIRKSKESRENVALPRSQQQEEKPYQVDNFSAKSSIFKSKHSASQLEKSNSPLTKVRGVTPASEE